MGLIFNGNGDVIKAVDGSLTVEGLDIGGSTNINAGIGTFSGNLNVGGVLTYEDVKNVDSVGVVTARAGLHAKDDSTFYGATSGRNVFWDKSENSLEFGDYTYAKFGVDEDLTVWSNNTASAINNKTGELRILSGTNVRILKRSDAGLGFAAQVANFNIDGACDFYHNGTKRIETTSSGATVTGILRGTNLKANAAIYADASANTALYLHSTGTTGQSRIFLGDASTFQAGKIVYDHTNDYMMFGTGGAGAERLRIDSSGNVNFGAEKAVALPSGTGIQVYSSANPRIKLVNDTTGNAAGDGFQLYLSGSGVIFDQKETAEMRFYTSATERMRIASTGKVGIGTVTPGKQLHVYKSNEHPVILERGDGSNTQIELRTGGAIRGYWGCSTTSNFMVYDNDTSDINFTVLQTGNVGIGIANPSNKLEISGGLVRCLGTASARFTANNGSAEGFIGFNSGTFHIGEASATTQIAAAGANYITMNTNSNERLRIDSSGNIGQAVTPSAWSSAQANDFFAYQVGSGTALFGRGSGDEDRGGISANLYCTASAWKYIANGNAGRIYFEDGSIVFNTCDSGSAGATATLNERFRITTAGSVMIGSGTPSEDLHLKKARANFLVEGTNDTVSGNVANINVRAPYYRKAGYSISDAGGNEDFWIGRPYGEGDTTAAVHINMGGTERLRILSGGNVKVSASSASGYVAEFNQTHTSNSAQMLINSPTDSNSRPSLINFSRAGTTKWTIGMGYNDAYNGFHISSGNLASGITGSDFVVTSDGKVGVGNYAADRTDPVTALLHVSTNWDNGDVPMVYFKGCNNEAPTSGSTNISFQISDENSNLLHKVWNTGGGNSDLGSVYYAGKMGIGEQTPLRRLHVASDDDLTAFTGGSYGTFAIENSQWDNGDYTAIDFMYNGSAKAVSRIASKITSSGASLHFGVSNNYGTGITHEALVLDYMGDMKGGYNPNASLWDSGSEKGWYYNRAGGSFQTATPANTGYASWYINKNTGNGGSTDRRYIDFYMNNNQHGRIEHNGASGTNYVTSSDYRLKENVVSITDGITEVKKLKPYRFNFKTDDDSKVVQGFFAHEAQEIVPYAVSGTKDGTKIDERGDNVPDYQQVDYAKFTPILTAAVKELIAEIETLKAEVAALKSA